MNNSQKLFWKLAFGGLKLSATPLAKDAPTFVTIGISHYCEKSRWMLDLSPEKYYEEQHSPALHIPTTLLRLNEMKKIDISHADITNFPCADAKLLRRKEKTGVPKLVIPCSLLPQDAQVSNHTAESHMVLLHGSRGISRYLMKKYPNELSYLYPSGMAREIVEIEDYLEEALSQSVAYWIFGNMLLNGTAFHSSIQHPTVDNQASINFFLQSCIQSNIPLLEKLILQFFGHSQIIPLMIEANGFTAEIRDQCRVKILEVFQKMENIYNKGHNSSDCHDNRYLLGTKKITAADISLAAFAAPVLFPPQAMKKMKLDSFNQLSLLTTPGVKAVLKMRDQLMSEFTVAKAICRWYENDR